MSPHLCLCSAFQPRLQRASQMLHVYSSVSQKRPQSAAVSRYTRLSLFRHQFLSSHLPFAWRTSRGTPPNIYPVNTQPLCTRKTFASVSLSKTPGRLHISLYWERCKVFIKMTSFCLCLLFVSLSTPFPCLSVPPPVNALKKFRGTLL